MYLLNKWFFSNFSLNPPFSNLPLKPPLPQVKAGSIFDNILITDDEDFARNLAKETFEASAAGEKEKKDAKDEDERKKREDERKAREAAEAEAEADVS